MPVDLISRIYPPKMTCVYRLFDRIGRLIYVGVAYDFDKRFRNHRKARWWPEVVRTDVIWFSTRLDAMYEEARAIATEQPINNKRPGIDPVGLMVIRRYYIPRHGPYSREGELIVSKYDKEVALREMRQRKTHLLYAVEGEVKGVIIPMDWYLRGRAALGEPEDISELPRMDYADL